MITWVVAMGCELPPIAWSHQERGGRLALHEKHFAVPTRKCEETKKRSERRRPLIMTHCAWGRALVLIKTDKQDAIHDKV